MSQESHSNPSSSDRNQLGTYRNIRRLKLDNAADLLYTSSWKNIFQRAHMSSISQNITNSHHDGLGPRKVMPSFDQEFIDSLRAMPTQNGLVRPHVQDVSKYLQVCCQSDESETRKEMDEKAPKESKQTTAESSDKEKAENSSIATPYDGCLMYFSEMLIERIELMWKDLGIPLADRKYYRKTLFAHAWKSWDNSRALSFYYDALINHREEVLHALNAIRDREMHRNSLLLFVQSQQRIINESGYVDLFSAAEQGIISSYCKQECLNLLCRLQQSTINVVKSIQSWRKTCWRPHAFRWKGENYLMRIARDRIQNHYNSFLMDLLRIIKAEMALPDLSLVLQVDPRPSHRNRDKDEEKSFASDDKTSQHDINQQTLKVIVEEEKLQRVLIAEIEALESQGVFIPTIRL